MQNYAAKPITTQRKQINAQPWGKPSWRRGEEAAAIGEAGERRARFFPDGAENVLTN